MMEIWIRSFARAGGVEMPASARVLERQDSAPRLSVRGDLARFLRQTAERLVRMAERVDPRAPNRTAPCG